MKTLRQLEESGDFQRRIGHRAIGVVYNPHHESPGYYVPSITPERYDAFIFLDVTEALHPLKIQPHPGPEPPDTYPWGLLIKQTAVVLRV